MSSPRKHTSKIRQELETSGDSVRRARLPKRMRIAFKIADAIDALDWDKKDLAEKLGKYQSQITNWLKGDHNFTVDTLSDIEEILGIKIFDLEDNEPKPVAELRVKLEVKAEDLKKAETVQHSRLLDSYISVSGGLQAEATVSY